MRQGVNPHKVFIPPHFYRPHRPDRPARTRMLGSVGAVGESPCLSD